MISSKFKIARLKAKFLAIFCFSYLLVAISAQADEIRILVFGDSFAAGYGLPHEEGFCAALERHLRADGLDARVINAGVSGDTSYSGLARADATMEPPHEAMILELGANDMLRALPPAKTEENLAALIEKSEVPVFLLGMRAMPNYGPVYQRAFDAIYPRLAKEHETGFYPFIFDPIFEGGVQNSWRYFQRDLIHPNAKGVEKVMEGLVPELAKWLEAELLVKEAI